MAATREKPARNRLISGPGTLLVWLYGVMVVGAVSRSVYQIATEFDRAPLAYSLSAVAGLVYGFITYSLVRGGEQARRAALVCCAAELVGVLTVGTWALVDPSAFPDQTVWSDYGMEYLFIPVILPISALYWLRKAARQGDAA
ncbi:Integral membrane protein OS=Streptomyces alboniger OX=132473 GN=CP975_05945 PE=4 SV=1 [Streptomyces alboniger]